jgi:hypothetical protein
MVQLKLSESRICNQGTNQNAKQQIASFGRSVKNTWGGGGIVEYCVVDGTSDGGSKKAR